MSDIEQWLQQHGLGDRFSLAYALSYIGARQRNCSRLCSKTETTDDAIRFRVLDIIRRHYCLH